MNQYTAWNNPINSLNPRVLLQLIDNTILSQIEYQYSFATAYDQEIIFYMFHQGSMSNPHWY